MSFSELLVKAVYIDFKQQNPGTPEWETLSDAMKSKLKELVYVKYHITR